MMTRYLDTREEILSSFHGSIITSVSCADAGFTVLRSAGQDRNKIGHHRGRDHLARFTSQTIARFPYNRTKTLLKIRVVDSHEIVKRIIILLIILLLIIVKHFYAHAMLETWTFML